ncbi:MAG: acyl carrier protein [Gemmatimonadetes bacterium]|nr:acyl carrier protein [Gemmatimonadota bacterium]MBT7858735.1 acyl carrier protein [Gemmatimonadota bacterium]
MKPALAAQIRQIIATCLQLSIGPDELPDDEPLFLEDDFDSIGSLEIIDAIECTFDLRVSDDDLTQDLLYSVRSLTDYVEGRLSVAEQDAVVTA